MLWNTKLTVIQSVVSDLGTIFPKICKREQVLKEESKAGRLHNCQDLLEWLEELLRHQETCCHFVSYEKPTIRAGLKNPQEIWIFQLAN